MDDKHIIFHICKTLEDIQEKKEISGKICFRSLELPCDITERRKLVNQLEEQVASLDKVNTFDTVYQALSVYEKELSQAKRLNHRSQFAKNLLDEEEKAYVSFLDLLLRVDYQRTEKQMENIGSFTRKENIQGFYYLKNKKELLYLAIQELPNDGKTETNESFERNASLILLENGIDKQDALYHYGFITPLDRVMTKQVKMIQKQKILERYKK